MLRRVIARVLLVWSLWGYGTMMGPRQTHLTGTRDVTAFWTIAFAVMAVIAISLLIDEVKRAAMPGGASGERPE